MEPKDRLLQAIQEAGFDGPTEAWRANQRALGISKDLVISNCNGNRPISRKAAERYAQVFGRTAGWYLYGEGGEPSSDRPTMADALKIYSELPDRERKEFLQHVLGLVDDDQTGQRDAVDPQKAEKSPK